MERNRISSLQSHWKALEKEWCLPGIFCDSGDTPANLLCELSGHLISLIIIIIIILAHQHKACRQLKITQEMTAVGD